MSEWGPWTEHDGKGCPCVGQWVEGCYRNGETEEFRATGGYNEMGSSWDWGSIPDHCQEWAIVSFRIRKPRGLAVLENLIADLPAPTRKVDA